MSRSQFQSKRFILRHAWLNLWDERMTTGRINQIATLVSRVVAIYWLSKKTGFRWSSTTCKTRCGYGITMTNVYCSWDVSEKLTFSTSRFVSHGFSTQPGSVAAIRKFTTATPWPCVCLNRNDMTKVDYVAFSIKLSKQSKRTAVEERN